MVERTIRVNLVGDASSLVTAANQARTALMGLSNVNLGKVGAGLTDASKVVNQAGTGFQQAGKAADEATQKASGWSQALKTGLSVVGIQSGVGAIVSGFKAVMTTGLDFQGNLNTLSAVTGANVDEMKALGTEAKRLGADITIPGANAADAAEGMKELAKGGLTVDQTLKATRGTLLLAAAAQVDGATAATIQSKALQAFRMPAEQAGHVADVLANAANAATGEVTDMAMGLQQSATVAAGFGIGIDDTATSLALFAKNGVIGSDAGTSLKTMLTQLASPTKQQKAAMDELNLTIYDAQGNFVGMKTLTEQLATAHGRMTTEQYNSAAATLFGTDALRAANILGLEGVDGYDKMYTAVTRAGGAQELAAAQMVGLNGALDRISNAASDAAISLFEKFQPAMTGIVDGARILLTVGGDLIGFFLDLPSPVLIAAAAFAAFKFIPWGKGMHTLTDAFKGFGDEMRLQKGLAASQGIELGNLGSAAATAQARYGGMLKEIGKFSAVIGASLALDYIIDKWGDFTDGADKAEAALHSFDDALLESNGAWDASVQAALKADAVNSDLYDTLINEGINASTVLKALTGDSTAMYEVMNSGLDAGTLEDLVAWGGHANNASRAAQELNAADTAAAEGFVAFGQSVPVDALRALHDETGDTTDSLGLLTGAYQSHTAALVPAEDAAKQYADTLQAAAEKAQYFVDNSELATYVNASKDALNDAARAADYFKAKLDELDGRNASYEDQLAAQAGAIDRVREALEKGTAAATENTEAGNLNVDAMNDWNVEALVATDNGRAVYAAMTDLAGQHLATAEAAGYDAAKHGDVAGATALARAEADKNRQAFIDLALQYNGGNLPAAEALADKLGVVAGVKIEDKDFQVIADAQAADDTLDAINAKVVYDKTFSVIAQPINLAAGVINEAGTYDPALQAARNANGGAEGGWVSGPGGPKEDKVKARLSPGEFVVNAAQAKRYGALLEIINSGIGGMALGGWVRGFAEGGAVAASADAVFGGTVEGVIAAPDVAGIEAAWKAVAAAVQDAWRTVIAPTLDELRQGTLDTGAEFARFQVDVAEPVWTAVAATVQNNWSVINGLYAALNAGTIEVGVQQRLLLDAQVVPVWTLITDVVARSWNGIIRPTFDQINAGADFLGAVQVTLSQTATSAWGTIGTSISDAYNNQIVPAWNGVQAFALATGDFFVGVRDGISGATTQATGDIAEITTAMNDFFTMVSGQVAANAPAAVPAPALADGGPITAGTGPRSDDVIVRVSRGEYVVNAASTAKHRSTLDAINYGGYADGGMVGEKIRPGVESAITGGFQNAISAVVSSTLSKFPGGASGAVVINGNIIVNGITAPLPVGERGAFMQAVASQMGTSYLWGGASPPLFDCSGLMSWALAQAGADKGRLTAAGFNHAFPHIGMPGKPGDLVTFDTGRIPGDAGHIGAILDPAQGLMMHTDGAGPARVGDYKSRDGGPLSVLDVFGGALAMPVPDPAGDPPAAGWLGSLLARIKTGGTGAPASAAFNPSGGVEQWRSTVIQALTMIGQLSDPNVAAVLNQVSSESGGDPMAINLSDPNAQRGIPSKGLVQVIDPTFSSYALPGYNTNIYDPLSNILAGVRYAIATYGSILAGMRGVAYDTGGMVQPGLSMVYNGLSTPEPVLNDRQWAIASNAMNYMVNNVAAGFGGRAVQIHVTFAGDGVITDAMAATARVTVDGALVQTARVLATSRGQA